LSMKAFMLLSIFALLGSGFKIGLALFFDLIMMIGKLERL